MSRAAAGERANSATRFSCVVQWAMKGDAERGNPSSRSPSPVWPSTERRSGRGLVLRELLGAGAGGACPEPKMGRGGERGEGLGASNAQCFSQWPAGTAGSLE